MLFRSRRKEGRTTTRIVAQEHSVALPIMAAQSILVQRGGEDSPRCVVDRDAERAWVDLDERLGAVCAVSPRSGSESAGSGGLGGVAVGHGGATYVGGGSSKEGVGLVLCYNSFDLSSSASPARMVGAVVFMARKTFIWGRKGGRYNKGGVPLPSTICTRNLAAPQKNGARRQHSLSTPHMSSWGLSAERL